MSRKKEKKDGAYFWWWDLTKDRLRRDIIKPTLENREKYDLSDYW